MVERSLDWLIDNLIANHIFMSFEIICHHSPIFCECVSYSIFIIEKILKGFRCLSCEIIDDEFLLKTVFKQRKSLIIVVYLSSDEREGELKFRVLRSSNTPVWETITTKESIQYILM
jgi:hypothetical protein